MTDHKFTDDDVIKALECHIKRQCWNDCPNATEKRQLLNKPCSQMIAEDALALINRQKVEIESLKIANEKMYGANKGQEAEIEKLKGSRDRWKQIATDFDKASRETEKEIERLTTLAGLGNMRANDYREMRNKLKKANAEIERLKKIGDDKTSEVLRHDAAIRELHTQLETAKSEAIKEFAWRLKNILTPYPEAPFCEMVGSLDIDALVKEMTEGE